jgi:hypothetical protein
MPARVGIEVSAGRCRVVEVDVRPRKAGQAAGEPVRVRRFHTFDWDTSDPASLTAGLKGARTLHHLHRHVWVTLWNVPGVFRFLQLPPASPLHLEAIARRESGEELARWGSLPGDSATGIILGETADDADGRPRREVAFAAASTPDIRTRLAPIVAAGFTVDGVLTPALALVSLARLVPAGSPGAAVAYLALGAEASSLVILRNGLPLFAREMPWGYQGHARRVDREALANRLASELRRSFLFFKQTFRTGIDLLLTCGDYRELRSLTAPLIAALDVEIETLDSPAGIDLTSLPAPDQRFREELAGLRLAWAAAADPEPPVNLLPPDIRLSRDRRRQTLRLGAGLAAGLVVGAALYLPADRDARQKEARVQELRQALARMEPLAREREQARQTSFLGAAQKAALASLGGHGPRLGRALEHIAAAAPPELSLTSLTIRSEGASWQASIGGLAVADNPAAGQAAVNSFLRMVAGSPYFEEPIAPPALRVISATRTGSTSAEKSVRTEIPDGKSGVVFTIEFPLPR